MAQTPKYMMVIENIKKWIDNGEVKPGDKIYSENELSKMFDVSRHTVRQAIGELVHQGLLYREQGAGTFCSHPSEPTHITEEDTSFSGKNIGIITTYISDYIFPSIIRGMESYAASKGYSLFVSSTNNDLEKEKQCLEAMLSRDVAGLIIEPTKSSDYNPNIHYYLELEQKGVPYLMINQYYSQLNPPYIVLDDEQGGFMATSHLIELGHEKIIGLFKTDDMQGVYRMKGLIRAFRDHKILFSNDTIVPYTTEDLQYGFKQKLDGILDDPDYVPTGIVCYNDEVAVEIIQILREKGYRVPEDISIIGYDDSVHAIASEVKLTTLSHPKAKMGEDAAKWLIDTIENNEKPQNSIVYTPELVVRESTRKLT